MSYKEEYSKSLRHPEAFWGEKAKAVDWFTFPEEVLTKNEIGLYRWFEGGKLNTSYLCLDYHVDNGRADQDALIYDSPVTKTITKFTFRELRDQVALFAGVLSGLGVTKGDTVVIYMPSVPEAVIGMLACARLGAVHSVVFGGFAPHELAIRIEDAKPKVILSASCGIEFQRIIPYKPLIDKALEQTKHQPEHHIILQRDQHKAELISDEERDWREAVKTAKPADCVSLDAFDPLYILYTSGTTGKPKGVVRDNGGHAVAMKYSMEKIYGTLPGEVFWAASDVGWQVAHSYTVYGPLINGSTTVLFEGKPIRTPDAGTFWRVMSQHKVKAFFTAPTAIRAIKKEDPEGELLRKYDLSALKYFFVAGEKCDHATYEWSVRMLQKPVIDHWWQTESGSPMLCNLAGFGLGKIKPGSVGRPVPGYDVQVMSADGELLGPDQQGLVVIRLPLGPGFMPTLWQDDQDFIDTYLSPFEGYYLTGDGGYKDQDNYFYIMGRIDDVINVSGHRLSTGEMEEILADHPAVAECAVVGIADELKGQRPVGFVVLKDAHGQAVQTLEQDLVQSIREKVGAIAVFKTVVVVKRLPKTRSGKTLRKVIRKMADGEEFKMPSTIEDPKTLDEIRENLRQMKVGVAFRDVVNERERNSDRQEGI